MTIQNFGIATETHGASYGDVVTSPSATTKPAATQQPTAPSSSTGNALADAPDRAAPVSQLQINIDAKTGQIVIQIKNGNTTEIIRKIPAEDVVEFAQSLDSPSGNIVKTKA